MVNVHAVLGTYNNITVIPHQLFKNILQKRLKITPSPFPKFKLSYRPPAATDLSRKTGSDSSTAKR